MVGSSTVTISHTNGNNHVGSGAVGNKSPQKIKDEGFSVDILKWIDSEKYINPDWNSTWSSSMRTLRSQVESRGTRSNSIPLGKTNSDVITDTLEEDAIKSLRLRDESERDNLSELKEILADDPDFSKPEEQIDMDLIYGVFGVDELEQSIVDNKDQWRRI